MREKTIVNLLKSLSRVPLCSVLLSLVLCISLFLSAIAAQAGTPFETKTVEQPPIHPTEPWRIVVGAPAWLTFLNGDIGINGVKTHVDISPTDILRHTNFLSSLEGEVSKGRVGIRGEYLYLNAAEGVFGNGLVYKVDLHLREFAAGFGVSYRIIQGPKGWLDLRAGIRYTNLFRNKLSIPMISPLILPALSWSTRSHNESARHWNPLSSRISLTSFKRSRTGIQDCR